MQEQIPLESYPALVELITGDLSDDDGFEVAICGYVWAAPEKLSLVIEEITELLAKPYSDETFVDFLAKTYCCYLAPEGGRATLEGVLTSLRRLQNTSLRELLCLLLMIANASSLDQGIQNYRQIHGHVRIAKAIEELNRAVMDDFPEAQARQLLIDAKCEALLGDKTAKAVLNYILDKLQDEAFR